MPLPFSRPNFDHVRRSAMAGFTRSRWTTVLVLVVIRTFWPLSFHLYVMVVLMPSGPVVVTGGGSAVSSVSLRSSAQSGLEALFDAVSRGMVARECGTVQDKIVGREDQTYAVFDIVYWLFNL